MSTIKTSSVRKVGIDHFEPEEDSDPQAQRKLRGYLERIDYTAYAANREIVGHILGAADLQNFQMLALAAANARARWVAEAVAMTADAHTPEPDQITRLAQARTAFDELSEAYEAMRRMVDRGYLSFSGGD